MRSSLAGVALAAACLAGFTAARSGQGSGVRADGTVSGHLYGVGGPAGSAGPPAPRPWPGTATLTSPAVHRDVPVGASGTFSVMVPPGRYTVVGHSPLYGSGTYLCRATRVVTVTSAHTARADVLCQMS